LIREDIPKNQVTIDLLNEQKVRNWNLPMKRVQGNLNRLKRNVHQILIGEVLNFPADPQLPAKQRMN
jgi:hypothetical protein